MQESGVFPGAFSWRRACAPAVVENSRRMDSRLFLVLAGLSGACAVALGAYGAHAVGRGSELYPIFSTASSYHFYHTLALALSALWLDRIDGTWARRLLLAAAVLFAVGIVLFAGSLYANALSGGESSTRFAPMGGTSFIVGWLCLGIAGVLKKS